MTAIAGKFDSFENSLLQLIFNNVAIANIGDAGGLRASVVAGLLYFALHTADPTEEGNQGSSEITYTLYARTGKARSAAGFTVTLSSVIPNGAVTFPAGSGGSGTGSFFSIGVSATAGDSGVGLYGGAISPAIVTGAGVTPQLSVATTVSES